MDTTLIVPGLHGSGPDHWQSWFERKIANCVRVVQSDWSTPNLPQWSAKLRRELNRVPGRVWIVAHSFGCLAAVQTAFDYSERISGLMLVAPADPARFGLQDVIARKPARGALHHRRQHQRSLDVVRTRRRLGRSLGIGAAQSRRRRPHQRRSPATAPGRAVSTSTGRCATTRRPSVRAAPAKMFSSSESSDARRSPFIARRISSAATEKCVRRVSSARALS